MVIDWNRRAHSAFPPAAVPQVAATELIPADRLEAGSWSAMTEANGVSSSGMNFIENALCKGQYSTHENAASA